MGLSERYGLSRTPVREIFRRLEGEGYVDIRDNRGARVIPDEPPDAAALLPSRPDDLRRDRPPCSAELQAETARDLKDTQERFRSASVAGDALSMVLENNRFHEIIGEMSGNGYLQPSLRRLLIDHARIGHTFFRPRNDDMRKRLRLAVDHHDGFIAAIGAHDEDTVVDLVFEHWDSRARTWRCSSRRKE